VNPDAEYSGRWGTALLIRTEGAERVAACAHCRAELGSISDGWEGIAGRVPLSQADLGRHVHVHEELVAVQYVCPACQTALWTDTEPAAGKSWRDFELAGT
jgi:N-methylhydantoinase B